MFLISKEATKEAGQNLLIVYIREEHDPDLVSHVLSCTDNPTTDKPFNYFHWIKMTTNWPYATNIYPIFAKQRQPNNYLAITAMSNNANEKSKKLKFSSVKYSSYPYHCQWKLGLKLELHYHRLFFLISSSSLCHGPCSERWACPILQSKKKS